MKYKELKNQPEAEVRRQLAELAGKAHDMAVKIRLNQHKNTHQLAQLKKDIARIKTYLRSVAQ